MLLVLRWVWCELFHKFSVELQRASAQRRASERAVILYESAKWIVVYIEARESIGEVTDSTEHRVLNRSELGRYKPGSLDQILNI